MAHLIPFLALAGILLLLGLLKNRTIGRQGHSRMRARMMRWRIRLRMRPGPGFASATELSVRWSRTRCVLSGRRSRPSLPFWARLITPATAYGVRLGRAQWFRRAFGRMEDQCLMVAPPRAGKSGALADRILDHPGPALVTTTRADLYNLTAAGRRALGPVEVFNPQGVAGLPSTFSWDVVRGCTDPATAIRRAQALTGAVPAGDLSFWVDKAAAALAALLHAADLGGHTILDVYGWANRYLGHQPGEILSQDPRASRALLSTLSEIEAPGKTADSIRVTMSRAMAWVAIPSIADAVTPGAGAGLDVRHFVEQRSTLYLIASDAAENSPVGPLFRALAEEIHFVGGILGSCGPYGRLDPPLLFALDEVCQVCPVPLPSWMADSAGKGILIVAVCHGLGQLEARYGLHGAQAIWETAGCKIFLGGIDDDSLLASVSRVCGDVEINRDGETYTSVPVVPVDVLRTLAEFRALVLRTNLSPCVVKLRMAWKRRDYRKAPQPRRPVFPVPAQPARSSVLTPWMQPGGIRTGAPASNGHANGSTPAHD